MAIDNILDQSDPREIITDRRVNVGIPRREDQYPKDGSALPDSIGAPSFQVPDVTEAGAVGVPIPVPPPAVETEVVEPPIEGLQAPSIQVSGGDTSSVLGNIVDSTNVPPTSYTVEATPPPPPELPPIFAPGTNVYDQINAGFSQRQQETNAAISDNITQSYNDRPALDRIYVDPFVSLERLVSDVRSEAESWNAQTRANNAQATEHLAPKPNLTPNAQDVLRQLPLLNSTNPVLNQIPGGLTGQMGEAPGFDQRWLSGNVLGSFLNAARNIGQTIVSGDAIRVLPNIARGISNVFGNLSGTLSQLQTNGIGAALNSGFQNYQSASRRGLDPALAQRLQRNEDSLRSIGTEALLGYLPQETSTSRPGNETYRIDPLRGYFGEMGAGLPGLALYGLAGVGNLVNATVYTGTDAIGAIAGQRPQGTPGFNPLFRYGQVAQGVDLGFFNNVGINNSRYLSTILPSNSNGVFGANHPYLNAAAVGLAGGLGFAADMFTGGLADNAAISATRFAARRGIYTARNGLRGLNVLPNSTASNALGRLQAQQQATRAAQAVRGIPDFNPANAPAMPAPTPTLGSGASVIQGNGFTMRSSTNLDGVVQSGSADLPTSLFRVEPPGQIILSNGISGQQRLDNIGNVPLDVPERLHLSAQESFERSIATREAAGGQITVVSPTGRDFRIPTDTAPTTPTTSISSLVPADLNPTGLALDSWVTERARQLTAQPIQVQVVDLGTTPDNALPGTPDRPLLQPAAEPNEVLDATDGRTVEQLFTEATAEPSPPGFTPPEGYQVNAERTNTIIDTMLDSGRPISERTMRVIPGVDTSGSVVELRGRRFVRDGDNWVNEVNRQAEAPNTSSVLAPSGVGSELPVAPVAEMRTTSRLATIAGDVADDVTPNGSVARAVAAVPNVRPALVDEAVRNNVVRLNTEDADGILTDAAGEARELLDYIKSMQNTFDNLGARVQAEPNAARRLELFKQRNGIERQIRDAQDELALIQPPTDNARRAFNQASPIITQSDLRASMNVADYKSYLDSPDYLTRVGAVDAGDLIPVRRTNNDLTRLAKFLTGTDGTPLMNPQRKSSLNSREVARLRDTHGDLFSQYGKPIPADLLNPQARIEVTPATVGAPQTTQFVARQPEIRVTQDDRLIDTSIRANGYAKGSQAELDEATRLRKAKLYEEQADANVKSAAAIEQARLDILADLAETGDMSDEAVEGLLSLNKAYQEIPNAVDNPRVVRNYVERTAPRDMQVNPANDGLVSRFLVKDEELADQGQALRELNENIIELQGDVAATTDILDDVMFLQRGNTADELANANQFYDPGNPNLPDYQANALDNTTLAPLVPVEPGKIDVSEYIQPADSMAKKAVGSGAWFHGSQVADDALYSANYSPGMGSSSNELGAGLYLTNRADLAQVYAKSERNITTPYPGTARLGTPTVYQFQAVSPVNPLYVSQKITPEVQEVFDKVVVDTFTDDAAFLRNLRSQQGRHNLIQDQWLNVREAYEATYKSPISELQYQQFQRRVANSLYMDLGYDSLLQVDQFRGKTLVVLDPTDVPGNFWNKTFLPRPMGNSTDYIKYMDSDYEIPKVVTDVSRSELIGNNLGLQAPDTNRRLVGGELEPVEARLNRHQSDALLNAAHQRKSTLAWEQQSRQALSGQMLDDYVAEYNRVLDDGIVISEERFRALEQVKEAALRDQRQTLQSLINTAPDVAKKEAKKYLNISKNTPCL